MLDPPVQPGGVDVDDEAHPAVEGHGERLRSAHAATAAGEGQRSGERAGTITLPALPGGDLVRDGSEGLVGPLDDALGPDVNPRPGGHLAVHRQAEVLQAPELRPGRPVADEVGVGDEHPRRPLVRSHDPHRATGLHEHRLVLGERAQRGDHGVEGPPVAGRASGAAVDDQVVRALGDVTVEVVHEHPHGGLGLPAAGRERAASRCPDLACAFHADSFVEPWVCRLPADRANLEPSLSSLIPAAQPPPPRLEKAGPARHHASSTSAALPRLWPPTQLMAA